MSLSRLEKKNHLDVIEVHTSLKKLFSYIKKCVHETIDL